MLRSFLAITILACSVLAVNAADSQDSQLFINGFNAYQKGDYPATIDKMTQVLTKHPETPLRDMALFWLARANFKAGNQREAARYLSQFNKEYPDSPLKGTIEEDLAALVPRYERGEQLPSATAQLEKSVVIPLDSDNLAKEKAAAEQLAAAKAAAETAAREKAAAEQAAAEQRAAAKATEERLRAEQAEIARSTEAKAAEQIALAKAAAENAAREKAEAERVAAERLAAAQAAEERLKIEKAEAARLAEAQAAEQIAAAKAAAAKAEAERQAAEAAAAAKVAAARAESEKAAAERAASDAAAREKLAATMATEKALRDQLASEQAARQKAEAEKATAEKLAAEQIASARSEAERQAKALLAQEEANRRQTETEQQTRRVKLLESSLAAEKAAREQAEAEKAALEKTSSSQLAAAQADLARLEAERSAAQKATQANLDAALAAERAAREKAEADRTAAEKAAEERVAVARAAADKANAERQAAEKAAQEYQTTASMALKAAKEARQSAPVAAPAPTVQVVGAVPGAGTVEGRLAAERSAREKAEAALESERVARLQAEEQRAAADRRAAELLAAAQAAAPVPEAVAAPTPKTAKGAKSTKSSRSKTKASSQLREKAVAEYKRIIDRFPGSRAAASATAKLKELGIVYGTPAVEPDGATMTSSARVLAFEVGQYASLDLTGQATATIAQAGSRVQIPFALINTGNGPDTFALSTTAPADLHAAFAAASAPEQPLTVTPPLAPGEQFKGVVTVSVPSKAIDGERLTFPIRAASQFTADVSQSREIRLVSAAPLLRALIKAEKTQLLPGETVSYKVTLLNVGSAAGRDLSFRLIYPAQLLPSGDPSGSRREAAGALVLEPITLQSGESRELSFRFQLGPDALAQQELFLQGELTNPALNKRDSFLAQAVTVQTVRGVSATTANGKVTAIPGQKVVIPITVTNTGNVREDFSMATAIPGSVTYAVYQDQNRDGLKQAGEPVINHVGPLAPREVAHVLLEIATATSATDGSSLPIALSFVSDADRNQAARIDLNLLHARPVLDLAVDGRGGKLKPGEVSTFVLDCVNRGSSLAKVVELESILPEPLELVAADPAFTRGQNGRYLWAFEELGTGEKRSIKVTYRIKTGTVMGTNVQLKNLLSYQDLQGNRY